MRRVADRAADLFPHAKSHAVSIAPRPQAFFIPLSQNANTVKHIEPMPSTSLNCFTLLLVVLLLGGVSPAAGQNNVFANRAALLVARNSSSPSADSTVLGPHKPQQHAGASHGRELQSSGCRSDICGDRGGDCYAPTVFGHREPRSCTLPGYVVVSSGDHYQCCPSPPPSPPPAPPFPPGVFPNRAALLVARDAWCADPTAAAAIYGPISLWDISQVTDLSFVFCAASWASTYGGNPACSNFNSDISGWDTSGVTTLDVRAATHPLHPSL